MIKYQPNRTTPSASCKEEKTFETLDEMIVYLLDRCTRFAHYIGSDRPFRMEDLIISNRTIFARRGIDNPYRQPVCIGFYQEI